MPIQKKEGGTFMEKNTKKFDVKVILGKDNESVKKVDVNGKIYKRRTFNR